MKTFEQKDNAIVMKQDMRLDPPQELPSAVVTVAEWTQLCEAVDALRPQAQLLRLFWAATLGASVAGLSSTIGILVSDTPTIVWVVSLVTTVFLGMLTLLGYLVDRRTEDSIVIRIEAVKDQIRHTERLRPRLADRLRHPSDLVR